ncbi:MAG TPA: hypothetical protein PLW14_09120 [Chlorobiota bacterium]|nr:hypothetical protein [Chlorobiota bacterium]
MNIGLVDDVRPANRSVKRICEIVAINVAQRFGYNGPRYADQALGYCMASPLTMSALAWTATAVCIWQAELQKYLADYIDWPQCHNRATQLADSSPWFDNLLVTCLNDTIPNLPHYWLPDRIRERSHAV